MPHPTPLPPLNSIVTDPYLKTVLETSTLTRQHCTAFTSLLLPESTNTTTDPTNPPETLSTTTTTDPSLLSRNQKLLYAHLAHLRGLSRNALLKVRNTKQITAEARQEIDRLRLQLQNLYYEERHLRGEIGACEAYDHKYQQLPLLPLPDFLALHPAQAAANANANADADVNADGDEKRLMFARINHELEERKALEEERQALLRKKQGLIADNKKRKEDLAGLDRDLETFIDAAKPIQKIFEKQC